jgi:tRNA(fMet)-specific endonuclease VapC
MFCLDTDFLITFLRRDYAAEKKMEELLESGMSQATTTAVNALELYKGAFKSDDRIREIERVRRLLGMFNILALDIKAAEIAGEVHARLKSNSIGESDILIASIAMANGQTLLTRNARHFERVPGLKVESW